MAVSGLKISCLTLNVQGIRNPKTRKTVFRILKQLNIQVIALQETYLIDSDIPIVEKEWHGMVHFSAGTKRSKGLLTLFSPSFNTAEFSILYKTDRILTSLMKINNDSFVFCNIYSPCDNLNNKINFLNNIFLQVSNLIENSELRTENLIVLGDFNTCLSNEFDIVGGKKHPEKIVNKFNSIVSSLNLTDSYRVKFPETKTFTWTRKKRNKPRVSRRLDYIFVSEPIVPFIKNVEIKNIGFSDHRAMILTADFSSFDKGPSFYKLNLNLLSDINFINIVKNEISKISQYKTLLDPIGIWELIKVKIRSLGCSYSREKSLCNFNKKQEISKQLRDLENEMCKEVLNHDKEIKFQKLKTELEVFELAEARGARIRAGIKFAELDEKSNKFFLNLEKNRALSNTIFKLVHNNTAIDKCDEILTFIMEYFENIYKKIEVDKNIKDYDNIFLKKSNVKQLDENDKNLMDTELTAEEILNALKLSKNNSSPGLDGLPIEVYKVFWGDLKEHLTNCFHHCFVTGSLAPSQNDSILSLLHKGGNLDRENIANWRPIALLNSDYKLLTKIFAIRLQSVIKKLVDSNQCGFVKGRKISYMLREIYDLIEREKDRGSSSIMLSIDYCKAFDTVSTRAIMKSLQLYNFGDNFLRWIEIILKNRKCSVKNAGFISKSFDMERGVRQGCPVSPILFILTSELFAASVRNDPSIKGIAIPDALRAIKIRLFADDTTLFLRDLIDYREILAKIKQFSIFSGLLLNKSKSYAMCFNNDIRNGSFRDGIKFVSKIKILGVHFSKECEARDLQENFSDKIKSLEKICAVWSRRGLSILGKITILKAFGISLFVNLIQSIGIKPETVKIINSIMFRFIWHKPRSKLKTIERIQRKILCNNYEQGGLRMINLEHFARSFTLGWVADLMDPSYEDWKFLALDALGKVGGRAAFRSSVSKKNFKGLKNIKNKFWHDTLCFWLDSEKITQEDDSNLYLDSPLFNNKQLLYKKSPLFFSECIARNIIFIKDMFDKDSIISYDTFKSMVKTPNSLLIYNCIFNSLNKNLQKIDTTKVYITEEDQEQMDSGNTKLRRKCFYNSLNQPVEPPSENYWSNKLQNYFDKAYWVIAFKSTVESRLRVLHYKILMKIFPTATILCKMKIKPTELCLECGEPETIEHFFFECFKLKNIWKEVKKLINSYIGFNIDLTWDRAILGILKLENASFKQIKKINLIILLAKMSISKSKYGTGADPCIIFENELLLRGLECHN